MARYILGRLLGLLGAFIMVSIITFSLMHAVPGGPFDEEKQPLPPAAKANIMRKYGLDKPLLVQYFRYMWNALHFDFGIPYPSPTETVTGLIARVWPPTLQLAVGGDPVLLQHWHAPGHPGSDHTRTHGSTASVTVLSTMGIAVPNFVIGHLADTDFQRDAAAGCPPAAGASRSISSCRLSSIRCRRSAGSPATRG